MIHKNRKKFINFILLSAGISKLQFLIKKDKTFVQMYFSSSIFGQQSPGSRSDLDPDSLEMQNLDQQHCYSIL